MTKIESKEILIVPIKEIKLNPKNRNKHPKEQIDRLVKIIEYQGFRTPVTVSKRTGLLVAGHGRIMAAKKLGYKEVPAIFQDFESEEQEIAHGISDNAIALWSELDLQGINVDVPDLGPDFDIDLLGIKNFTIDVSEKEPGCDEDEVPEKVEPKAKLGDIYQLGNHRLMCGDSTNIDAVEKLMNGEKADMVFTSPPYNSGNGGFKSDYYGKKKDFYLEKTDSRTKEEYVSFCCDVLNNLSAILKSEECPVLWNVMYNSKSRNDYGLVVFGNAQPFSVQETICWNKGKGFPTASKGILSRDWELIFVLCKVQKYFSTQGPNEVRFARWDIPSEKQLQEHGACFPVSLVDKALNDFSIKDQNIYEPFCGSGTTLIASEKNGRKCFGMELDPHYCDVIVARWEKYTGQKAVLLNENS